MTPLAVHRRWPGAAIAALAALGYAFTPTTPPAHVPPPVTAESFDAYLARRLALSAAEGVRPGNQERLVRRRPGKAPVAILYLHGFGAARAEGEAVVDAVGETLGANVYYARRPGHGGDKETQARARSTDYLDVVDEAVVRAQDLGTRLVVIGSSTGGLLGTWAASRRPEAVDALVLASPLFGFRDRLSFLGGTPLGRAVIEAVEGPDRDASFSPDPEHRKLPGYDDHWITTQRWHAFFVLHEVFRHCATPRSLAAVEAPTLVLYTEGDEVVDVAAIKQAVSTLGSRARSHAVAIEDGNHILLSRYVRTDKPAITRAILDFLRPLL